MAKPFHESYSPHHGKSKAQILKNVGIKHHELYEAIADIPEIVFYIVTVIQLGAGGRVPCVTSDVYLYIPLTVWAK